MRALLVMIGNHLMWMMISGLILNISMEDLIKVLMEVMGIGYIMTTTLMAMFSMISISIILKEVRMK